MDRPKSVAVAFLPDDALVEILSGIPAKSLCRFKCVAKAWRDLIADRLRCNKLPQTLEGFFYSNDEMHGGGSDGNGTGDGGSNNSPRLLYGHFINTLDRSAPLVDSSFSFLMEQPGVDSIGLLGSCNGLLLFEHKRDSDTYGSLDYIVCNPATEQWVAVPSSGWTPFPPLDESEDSGSDTESDYIVTYLIFDPVVSSHFQLVQLWMGYEGVEVVHTYSSETGVWCEGAGERISYEANGGIAAFTGSAFVNGMLHLSITRFDMG